MARQLLTAMVIAVCAAIGAVACSGSSGTHVQSPPNSTRAIETSSPTDSRTSTASASRTSPVPTYGAAYPAVKTYMMINARYYAGLKNPAKFEASSLTPYVAGEAKIVLINSIGDEKKQGRAYRGTPDTSRVTVKSSSLNGSLPEVVLSDCPEPSTTWTEYALSSGKAVPTTKPKVAPPYAATIKMFQPNREQWVMTSFVLDGSRTCQP